MGNCGDRRDALRGLELVAVALTLTYGVGLWLILVHAAEGAHEHGEPTLALHWLRDSTLAFPVVLLANALALRLAARLWRGRRGSLPWKVVVAALALSAGAATAAGTPVHGRLFGAEEVEELPLLVHVARDGLLALVAAFPLAGAGVLALEGRGWRAARLPRRVALQLTVLGVLALGAAGAALAVLPQTPEATPSPTASTSFGLVSVEGARVLRAAKAEPPPHGAGDPRGKVELEVAVAVTNRLDRPVLHSPGQFRLRVGTDGPTITALRSSIRPGTLGPGATLDLRLVFIAPRNDPRLLIEFQDPEGLRPLRIRLPRLNTGRGLVALGEDHPSHGKENRP